MARSPEKTRALAQFLSRQIQLGKWPPGGQIPSEHELAAIHQVSRVTVRRAIDDLVETGLLIRRHGSGTYVRSFVAATDIAALFARDALLSSQGFVYQRLHADIENRIIAAGSRLQLALGRGSRAGQYAASDGVIETILRAGIGGVIGALFDLAPFRQVIEERRLPAVCLLGACQPDWAHSVHFDYEAMTRLAVDILKRKGIDEVTVFNFRYDPEPYETALIIEEQRLARLLSDHIRVELIEVPYTMEGTAAYDVFKRVWSGKRRPRAVFFRDDCICDIATRAILELGIRVPQELSILTHLSEGRQIAFPVPLNAVGFSTAHAASLSCDLLFRLIKDRSLPPCHLTVPPITIPGSSLANSR